ncbi:hypothetical protein E5720_03960 [Rhodococcus sp. PAMC28707]|uniref:hypothetical protein n=1 Tax=unclassified Rhodococcus (in: high G+C Gram-positive bacteria) TaxID=192944 RepID=UPI00109E27BE|nr:MULTISPECIES: hypothetical protein [unclassified Rhodococcus (in: high G+C Gram-positive bacteria)]QCB50541.1 hypothetical protein E5769_10055 [Rhodococcus sp. PAMC28705]QCB57767.1 hypothetical protein E5720_03960 [Rhodococcus sp. PAMC28707]
MGFWSIKSYNDLSAMNRDLKDHSDSLKARTEILKLRRRIQTLEKRAAHGKASQDESNELYWRRAELDRLKPTEPKRGEWPAPPTE